MGRKPLNLTEQERKERKRENDAKRREKNKVEKSLLIPFMDANVSVSFVLPDAFTKAVFIERVKTSCQYLIQHPEDLPEIEGKKPNDIINACRAILKLI